MSKTAQEYVGDGYYVTDQWCEYPGCDVWLGYNYSSDFCEEHRQ